MQKFTSGLHMPSSRSTCCIASAKLQPQDSVTGRVPTAIRPSKKAKQASTAGKHSWQHSRQAQQASTACQHSRQAQQEGKAGKHSRQAQQASTARQRRQGTKHDTCICCFFEGCPCTCPGLNQGSQNGRQNALAQLWLHKVGLHICLGPHHLCCVLWGQPSDVVRVQQGAVAQVVSPV